MPKIRRSSDRYIQLNKKITDIDFIKLIEKISDERKLSKTEVCYNFIREGCLSEIQKRQKV